MTPEHLARTRAARSPNQNCHRDGAYAGLNEHHTRSAENPYLVIPKRALNVAPITSRLEASEAEIVISAHRRPHPARKASGLGEGRQGLSHALERRRGRRCRKAPHYATTQHTTSIIPSGRPCGDVTAAKKPGQGLSATPGRAGRNLPATSAPALPQSNPPHDGAQSPCPIAPPETLGQPSVCRSTRRRGRLVIRALLTLSLATRVNEFST